MWRKQVVMLFVACSVSVPGGVALLGFSLLVPLFACKQCRSAREAWFGKLSSQTSNSRSKIMENAYPHCLRTSSDTRAIRKRVK
jgi:hypothetical protein